MYKSVVLRILATYEGKTAKISNFWTFWPVIQLHLWSIGQKVFCQILKNLALSGLPTSFCLVYVCLGLNLVKSINF